MDNKKNFILTQPLIKRDDNYFIFRHQELLLENLLLKQEIKKQTEKEEKETKPRKKTKKDMLKFDENNPKGYMDYLRTLLVDEKERYKPLGKFDDTTLNLDVVREASNQIKNNKASLFGDSITFGCMLKWVYYELETRKKYEVKENTGLSKRQPLRYEKLVPLSDYSKFYSLSVEMTNIYEEVEKI